MAWSPVMCSEAHACVMMKEHVCSGVSKAMGLLFSGLVMGG